MARYSEEFVAWITSLPMSSRAAKARDHLLEFGSLTTEQLTDMGYVHPPRAIGDLQDAGATISRESVKSSAGKNIRRYTLVEEMTAGKAGRVSIPKKFRENLNKAFANKCGICNGTFENRELQADHRVPFIVGGDKLELRLEDYMPLCASDNRSKSWSCEHCPNLTAKDTAVCESCFWAFPLRHTHVATRQERRIDLVFQDRETEVYDSLKEQAASEKTSIEELLKRQLGFRDY
ncbi:HNH endonuclease signature motif containing protein [Streptomyces sp. NPDC094473]|uniref:HNH endonuclease signature motif containing protein n=1 Tax=Streptomyces sp. NPDC094473 TaxID=3366068 RepID=UPI0037F60FB2